MREMNGRESRSFREERLFWWVLLASAVFFLPGVFLQGLFSGDETRVAGIVAEAFRSGDCVIPRLNGTPFLEYPPLYYGGSAALLHGTGVCEWGLKLFPALFSMATVALLYGFCRLCRLGRWTAGTACVILMTSMQFFANGTTVRVDIVLCFWGLLCMTAFVLMLRRSGEDRSVVPAFFLMAAALCAGMMTKGLVGAVLPAAGMGAYCLWSDFADRKFRWKRYVFLAGAFLTGIVPVILWGWQLAQQGGQEALYTAFVVNNLGRFTGSQGDHVAPLWGYCGDLPVLFLPWQVLLYGGVILLGCRVRQQKERTDALLLSLFLMPLLMLTAASSKRVVYLLFLAPMAAAVSAVFAQFLFDRYAPVREWTRKLGVKRIFGIVLLTGIVLNAAFAWHWAHRKDEESLAAFFHEAGQLARREQRQVVYFREYAPERTLGGGSFYLQGNFPCRSLKEYSGGRELWIYRRRKHGDGRADYHFYARLPEELEALRAMSASR